MGSRQRRRTRPRRGSLDPSWGRRIFEPSLNPDHVRTDANIGPLSQLKPAYRDRGPSSWQYGTYKHKCDVSAYNQPRSKKPRGKMPKQQALDLASEPAKIGEHTRMTPLVAPCPPIEIPG